MKRFFIALGLAFGLITLDAAIDPEVALSQIGYTTSGVVSDLSVGTADFSFQGDDLYVGWGASDDCQIEFVSATGTGRIQCSDAIALIPDSTAANGNYVFNDVPAAGASEDILDFSATVAAMNGSDAVVMLSLKFTNADHTSTGNQLVGVEVDDITGDAEATEYALFAGSGWDYGFYSQTGEFAAQTAMVLEFGATHTLSIRDQSAVVLADYNNWPDAVTDYADLYLYNVGSGETVAAMDGSDDYSVLQVEVVNADHTSTSNVLNGIEVVGITADAEAVEYAIRVGDGWDAGIFLDDTDISVVGSGTDSGIHIGNAAADDDFRISRNGGSSQIDFALGTNIVTAWAGTGSTISYNMVELNFTGGNSNGSDIKSALNIDVDAGNPASTGNELNGILIDSITSDPDALHYGIYVGDGWDSGVRFPTVTQANLESAANGSVVYCSDCNPDATCTGSGAGAMAFRIAGAWACELN